MRDILFRGKRIDTKEWVYGWYFQYQDKHFILPLEVKDSKHFYLWDYAVEAIPETVGQYTGLTDKNGREIFEGDVVYCRAGERRHGICEFEKTAVVEYGWTQSMWDMLQCDEIEIAGNIHDNPELLGGDNNV